MLATRGSLSPEAPQVWRSRWQNGYRDFQRGGISVRGEVLGKRKRNQVLYDLSVAAFKKKGTLEGDLYFMVRIAKRRLTTTSIPRPEMRPE